MAGDRCILQALHSHDNNLPASCNCRGVALGNAPRWSADVTPAPCHRVPRVYDGADAWAGPAPQQLLAKALQSIPGAAVVHTDSSISVNDGAAAAAAAACAAGSGPPAASAAAAAACDDGAHPTQTFAFSMRVSALGSEIAAEATAATAADAREAAALTALHKCAPLPHPVDVPTALHRLIQRMPCLLILIIDV